jgi:hydroxyacylglutathione hydrolase
MNTIKSDNPLVINVIKAFNDNYIWCIHSNTSQHIALVDPGDAEVCIQFIEENNLQLSTILITHRHNDHVGGVEQLVKYCNEKNWPLITYGPSKEAIKYSNVKVKNGDAIHDETLNIKCEVIDIPGHTLGHVAYIIEDNLFCGDTLFSGGCGRVFDGTSEELFHSLNTLSSLSEKTQVYCAHEYTMANLDFALTVDPTNEELINYYNYVSSLRDKNQSSIPSSICIEKKINPFLRCFDSNIKHSVETFSNNGVTSDLDTFIQLRLWKNEF